jgi:uncharacterized OsmC-like protein
MAREDIAAALRRAADLMQRRPELGPQDDTPARARWEGDMRVSALHDSGLRLDTDMPRAIGGGGEGVTPGWLLRAGAASCAVTRIVMTAAARGVELESVEAWVGSRSDLRGLLGMPDEHGQPVTPAPTEMRLHVRVAAPALTAAQLRELVEHSCRHAPVQTALQHEVPLALEIETLPR